MCILLWFNSNNDPRRLIFVIVGRMLAINFTDHMLSQDGCATDPLYSSLYSS